MQQNFRAKYSLVPRCSCYGFGHLRAFRVTAFSTHNNRQNLSPLPINLPINYFPEGSSTIFAEVWFHTDLEQVKSKSCQLKSGSPKGNPLLIPNLVPNDNGYLVDGTPIEVRAEAYDPKGNLRTFQDMTIEWNNRTVKVCTQNVALLCNFCGTDKFTIMKPATKELENYMISVLR